jgi:hypothetical protein
MNSLWMELGRAFSKGLRQSEITVNPTSSELTTPRDDILSRMRLQIKFQHGSGMSLGRRDILTRVLPCSEWVHHLAYVTREKEFASSEELWGNEAKALRCVPNLTLQNEGKCVDNQMRHNENSFLCSFVDSL